MDISIQKVMNQGTAQWSVAIVLIAGFLVDPKVILGAAAIYVLFIAYFALYSRHHLVSGTPEEEFAAIPIVEAAPH